ncbi:hypothetical protein HNQ59_003982 [Chitinivorax tropicus]|uniref:Uncharacterized protein n=1 Tax=Chitinivorax tropicus TaxID=714531 RepID=A0A840MTT5_9PROT|nr:hypothetical protein [Chitinivorax tropicus]MBB5020657.1 hypothetical protein [Chitinivorax tropicus]
MKDLLNNPAPPSTSSDFLNALIGVRIIDLVRYSWWPAGTVAAECGIGDAQAFGLTAGPLSIVFENGQILGLASDPTINSVVIWDESARRSTLSSIALNQDDELFPIFAQNEVYATPFWKQVVGNTLTQLTILKRKTMSAKEGELPSELGLRFRMQNGLSFVASHGLHNGSDDFSVLEESQLAPMELVELMMS